MFKTVEQRDGVKVEHSNLVTNMTRTSIVGQCGRVLVAVWTEHGGTRLSCRIGLENDMYVERPAKKVECISCLTSVCAKLHKIGAPNGLPYGSSDLED